MFTFSLVAVLTARGFHVKGRSLISEKYVPACPPQTHFIALLPSSLKETPQTICPPSKIKVYSLLFCIFFFF